MLQNRCNKDNEFEELSLELVEWRLLLKRCKQLLPLQKLYKTIMDTGAKIEPDYSIRTVISKGKGKFAIFFV